mmetsp:Transcript_41191/g.93120  ORF Transcript_41191/g.93120 Transcript_41191/m.93120 type:complete len:137 (+) Transcript_41191:272-682(+)
MLTRRPTDHELHSSRIFPNVCRFSSQRQQEQRRLWRYPGLQHRRTVFGQDVIPTFPKALIADDGSCWCVTRLLRSFQLSAGWVVHSSGYLVPPSCLTAEPATHGGADLAGCSLFPTVFTFFDSQLLACHWLAARLG